MVAFKVTPPIWAAPVIGGLFGIFHGHAHGTELPNSAAPLAYSLGFVLCTGLIHIGGISFGLLTRWKKGQMDLQAMGGAFVLNGFGYMYGIL